MDGANQRRLDVDARSAVHVRAATATKAVVSAAVRTIDATVGVCTRTRVVVVVVGGEDHWDDDASAASRAARGANDAATPDSLAK